jgi:hypothetical protein
MQTNWRTGNTVASGSNMNISVFHHNNRHAAENLFVQCPGEKFELVSKSPNVSWISWNAATG